MARIVRGALTRMLSGAFGIAAVMTVFSGLVSLTRDGAAIAPVPIDARKIEFSFTPPPERIEIKAKKAERESRELIPSTPGPGFERCTGCGAGPEPTISLHRVGFERRELGEIGSARGNGWVIVRFDVSPAGSVVNARVVDASPRGVFEKSALRAIERWRYRPAVVEGRTVERRGLHVRLSFVLEEA